jgi:hypothetical protein
MTSRRDTLSSLTSAGDLSGAAINVSAAIDLLENLSLDHIRGSNREQLLKFIDLCHHWHLLVQDVLEHRTDAPGRP